LASVPSRSLAVSSGDTPVYTSTTSPFPAWRYTAAVTDAPCGSAAFASSAFARSTVGSLSTRVYPSIELGSSDEEFVGMMPFMTTGVTIRRARDATTIAHRTGCLVRACRRGDDESNDKS
jgi:hypothetical protein